MGSDRRATSRVGNGVGVAARVMNDVGLAVWFAAAASRLPRGAPTGDGEARATAAWETGAIAVHSAGAAYLTLDNRERLARQRGVLPVAVAKAILTLAAMAATLAGRRRRSSGGAADRGAATLTGAALVANAVLGEQQRPRMVVRGWRARRPRWVPLAAPR